MTIEIVTGRDGSIRHYTGGLLHREDGPAVIMADGEQYWVRHGNLHREDGPAVITENGVCYWRIHGNDYSFNDWCKALNITNEQKTLLMLKYNTHDN